MVSFILANHRLFLIGTKCSGIIRLFLQAKGASKGLVFPSGLHEYSQSSWNITPPLLGWVAFKSKPSWTQKLNQKKRGHRVVTVESLYHIASWANYGMITAEPAFLWGKTVPDGWGAVREKQDKAFSFESQREDALAKKKPQNIIWTTRHCPPCCSI